MSISKRSHWCVSRKWLGIGAVVLTVCAMGLACSRSQKPASPKPSERQPAAQRPASPAQMPAAAEAPRKAKAPPRRATPREPLTEEAIFALRQAIEAAGDQYAQRIEARRVLFHGLRRGGRLEPAMEAFGALLDDVECTEGMAMAQRVAFADAGILQMQRAHEAAGGVYHLLLDRYGDGVFSAKALYQVGLCQLEMQAYAEAEQTWQRLIEEHDDSPSAPWGWRKLALAQTLQGQYDAALDTLRAMAAKYAGTHYGEYARMRRGYVLMAANRLSEARASYAEFLATYSKSKYRRLAEQQLADLDSAIVVARANGR